MKIGGLIICRMDSKRLPGKILLPIQGKPVLEHLIDRVTRANNINGEIVIATTERKVDDDIVKFLEKDNSLPVYRGATEDVASRVLECAIKFEMDYFLRINADSPFFDTDLIDRACSLAHSHSYDFITNLYPRSFPYGVSVELINTRFYKEIYPKFIEKQDYEHITRYLYNSIEQINYFNINNDLYDYSNTRLVIDDSKDYEMIKKIVSYSDKELSEIEYKEAIEIKKQLGLSE